MNAHRLENGMLVVTRSTRIFVMCGDRLINQDGGWLSKKCYSTAMRYKGDDQYDIMEVYRYKPTMWDWSIKGRGYHLVWEREEEKPKPKHMTVSEIEDKLGHKICIVKGE